METVLSVVAWWVVSFVLVALVPSLRALRGAFMVWQAVALGAVVGATDAPTLDDIQAALDADARRVEQPAQRKPRARRGGRPRKQREPLCVSAYTLRETHLARAFAAYLGTNQARRLAARVIREEARADNAAAQGRGGDAIEAAFERRDAAFETLWAMMEARAGVGLRFGADGGDGACFGFWPAYEHLDLACDN